MTDINVPTKTLAQRASVWLKKINEGPLWPRGQPKMMLCGFITLLFLLAFGAFAISLYRHDTQFVHIPAERTRQWSDSGDPFILQVWPVKRPYVGTYSATRLGEIEMELYRLMHEKGAQCMHAAALGVPVDTFVMRVGDASYIVRDLAGIEYIGEPKGGYHTSLIDPKKLSFMHLHPEIRLEFITLYQFDSGTKEHLKSPYHVTSTKLAHCLQLYYPK